MWNKWIVHCFIICFTKGLYALETCTTGFSSSAGTGSCDFSNGTCGYNLTGRWAVHTGAFWYPFSGNIHGGRSGAGDKYALFDISQFIVHVDGDVLSPEIAPGDYCVSFWYIMSEKSSNLRIDIINGTNDTTVWNSITDAAVNNWTQISFQVRSTRTFKLEFISQLAGYSAVGIDDIKIVSQNLLPKVKDIPGSCNFENGDRCGYALDPRWTLFQGNIAPHGHELLPARQDNASYVLYNATDRGNADNLETFSITSPTIPAGSYHLQFWYILPYHFSHLEVFTSSQTVMNETGTTGDWTKLEKDLIEEHSFNITFLTSNNMYAIYAFVGIDDIVLSQEETPFSTLTTYTTPARTTAPYSTPKTYSTPARTTAPYPTPKTYSTPARTTAPYSTLTAYTTPARTTLTYTTPTRITAPYSTLTTYTMPARSTSPYPIPKTYSTPSRTTATYSTPKTYSTPARLTSPYSTLTTYTTLAQTTTPYSTLTTYTTPERKSAPYLALTTYTTPARTTAPYSTQTTYTTSSLPTAPYSTLTTNTMPARTTTPYSTLTAYTTPARTTAPYSTLTAYTTPARTTAPYSTLTTYTTPARTTAPYSTLTTYTMPARTTTPYSMLTTYIMQTRTTAPDSTLTAYITPARTIAPYSTPTTYITSARITIPFSMLTTYTTPARITAPDSTLTAHTTLLRTTAPYSTPTTYPTQARITILFSTLTTNTTPARTTAPYSTSTAYTTPARTTTPYLKLTPYTTATPFSKVNTSIRLEDGVVPGCSSTGWNITVDMTVMKLLYPEITTNHIYFGDSSCLGIERGQWLIFQQGFRECLTSEKISNGAIIYENSLYYEIHDPNNPFIIRQHKWTYTVECDVIRNEATSSHVHHEADVHHSAITSHYVINMTFYSDINFMNQLPGNPIRVSVGDDVYVKVFTTASDWSVKLRLHTCYAKPSEEADDKMNYYIIKDGCEVDTNTHIISQSTHETRFVFQDFEYTTNREGFNIYCNATFCETKDYSPGCAQSCNSFGTQALVGKK